MTNAHDYRAFQVQPRLSLDQLRLFVRRKEHSNPMMDSVCKLLDRLATGASPVEIEELIRRDVQLALRVVKVAGAPAFGGKQIHSIRHAVDLLGYDQLRSIVSTVSLFSAASKRNLGPGVSAERFQRRSLLLALLSRTLAGRVGVGNEETHFMAGLLQECGYLPIARLLPERLEQIVAVLARTNVKDILELEDYYLGFTHVEAGRVFGEEYNFCEHVLEAISHHHCSAFAKQASQEYADIAHLASWIADQLGLTVFESCPPHDLDKYAAQRLGVDPSSLDSTFISVHQSANATFEVLASCQR
jgi:HD-like signal output (HDOD) protein